MNLNYGEIKVNIKQPINLIEAPQIVASNFFSEAFTLGQEDTSERMRKPSGRSDQGWKED